MLLGRLVGRHGLACLGCSHCTSGFERFLRRDSLPPPPPGDGGTLVDISVSVDRNPPEYGNRDKVLVTSLATDVDGNPVSGVTVDTVIDTPDFADFACLGEVTDESGEVRCQHKINSKRDGTGTYQVNVTATKDQVTVSDTTTFEVIQ